MNDDRFDRWLSGERRRMLWRDRFWNAVLIVVYVGALALIAFTSWLLWCVYVVVSS